METGAKILLTGAKGTVGNYVLGLAEAAGFRVVASDITSSGVTVPVSGEVRPADLRDRNAVKALVQGCDAVVHTAALLDAGANSEDLASINTDAVINLYEAALEAGVKKFLHVSTATLYAFGQSGSCAESDELVPHGSHGMSKYGAEVFLRGRHDAMEWTIVRPAPIYGRRGRHFAASLLAVGPILRVGTPLLPRFKGGPSGSMVHAEDVARALIFLLQRGDSAFEIYNVADDDPMPLGERLSTTFEAYGLRTVPAGRLPGSFLKGVGLGCQVPGIYQGADAAAIAAWRMVSLRHRLRPSLRPRLDREALAFLYEDLKVDTSKLRALGWRARFPRFDTGFREVLRWYQAERWVPRYN